MRALRSSGKAGGLPSRAFSRTLAESHIGFGTVQAVLRGESLPGDTSVSIRLDPAGAIESGSGRHGHLAVDQYPTLRAESLECAAVAVSPLKQSHPAPGITSFRATQTE